MLAEAQIEPDALVMIPPDGVDEVEPLVTPFLEKIIPYSGGKLEVADILDRFRSGVAQLWIIWEPETQEVIGVGSTILATYPRRKVCKAWMFAATDYRRCYCKLEELEEWARAEGCASIEITGRRGWRRVFKDYDEVACVLRKEL